MQHTHKHEFWWLILSLMVLVLLCASINVGFALTKMRSRTGLYAPQQISVEGPEAASMGWPSATPHQHAWPPPESLTRWSSFGFVESHAYKSNAEPGRNGYSMQVQHLGWPMPVIELKQMWWDWDDPALQGPESDPRPMLIPTGLVANPILVGVPLWLIVCASPVLILWVRRYLRARKGLCAWCGFEIEDQSLCPECGRARMATKYVGAPINP